MSGQLPDYSQIVSGFSGLCSETLRCSHSQWKTCEHVKIVFCTFYVNLVDHAGSSHAF
jgi:hypothetical protein